MIKFCEDQKKFSSSVWFCSILKLILNGRQPFNPLKWQTTSATQG